MQAFPVPSAAVAAALATAVLVSVAGCAGGERGFRPPDTGATHADANGRSGPASREGSGGDLDFARQAGAPSDAKPDQTGLATWYGGAFAGRKTSSGERFDPAKYTAAHRTLPFGTWVEVRRVETGRTVRVRINDRGPWGDSRRIIDLSKKAAEDLDLVRDGVGKVELRVVGGP